MDDEYFIDRTTLGGVVANTAAVIAETVSSPTKDSLLHIVGKDARLMRGTADGKTPKPRAARSRDVAIPSHFKLIFISVLVLTILAGIANIILAAMWLNPTPNEQSAFEAMGFAWKAGLGAILGLLGGKVA